MVRLAIVDMGRCTAAFARASARISDTAVSVVVGDSLGESHAAAACPSFASMMSDRTDDFDALLLGGAAHDRAQRLLDALQAGKHVLCHAPIGRSVTDVERAYSAAAANGACLMTQRGVRFHSYARTIVDVLAAGRLGLPGLLRVHDWRTPSFDSSVESHGQSRFRWIEEHAEFAIELFGAAPRQIVARKMDIDRRRCGVQLHFGFPNDGMALIDVGEVLPEDAVPYLSMSLIGASGAVYADDHRNAQLWFSSGGSLAIPAGSGDELFRRQLGAFLAAISDPRQARAQAEATRVAWSVAHAADIACSKNLVANDEGDGYEFHD